MTCGIESFVETHQRVASCVRYSIARAKGCTCVHDPMKDIPWVGDSPGSKWRFYKDSLQTCCALKRFNPDWKNVPYPLVFPWEVPWDIRLDEIHAMGNPTGTNTLFPRGTSHGILPMGFSVVLISGVESVLFPMSVLYTSRGIFYRTHCGTSYGFSWYINPIRYRMEFPSWPPMGLPIDEQKSHKKPYGEFMGSRGISCRIRGDTTWDGLWGHIVPMGSAMGPVIPYGKYHGIPCETERTPWDLLLGPMGLWVSGKCMFIYIISYVPGIY